jgi:phosphoribosylpyrophosphate synthetase
MDDLCSYGGTFVRAGHLLKEGGSGNIDLLVAHCEGSVTQGDLAKITSPIKRIYASESMGVWGGLNGSGIDMTRMKINPIEVCK